MLATNSSLALTQSESLSDMNSQLANETNACGTPATMSFWLIAVLSTLYTLTVIVGAVGNGIVIWIVFGRRYMRTVTNFFLLNLAIADFLNVTMNVPFVYAYIMNDNTWVFGAVYCKFQTFIGYCVLSTIVLTFMAMAVERYVAIIYPLKKRLSRNATLAVMLNVWLLSSALAMPAAYYADTFIRDTRVVCIAEWPDSHSQYIHDVALMVINYCLPVCVTCFAYTRVALVLWRSRQIGECTREQQESTNTKRKVVKMFVTVVVVFTLCWLPFHSYFVLSHTHPAINCMSYSSVLYLLIFWVAMTNSACNPVIYFSCNRRFRYNFIYLFRCFPCVRVTKLHEAIVRDGISTATTHRTGVNVGVGVGGTPTPTRETRLLLSDSRSSGDRSDRGVCRPAEAQVCIRNAHARPVAAEQTEKTKALDAEHK